MYGRGVDDAPARELCYAQYTLRPSAPAPWSIQRGISLRICSGRITCSVNLGLFFFSPRTLDMRCFMRGTPRDGIERESSH